MDQLQQLLQQQQQQQNDLLMDELRSKLEQQRLTQDVVRNERDLISRTSVSSCIVADSSSSSSVVY